MVFVLLLLTLTMLYTGFVQRQPQFSPVRMFLYGWLLVYLSWTIGMVVYDHSLSILTISALALAKGLFVLGAYVANGRFDRATLQPSKLIRDGLDRASLLMLAILTLAGVLLVGQELFLNSGRLFGESFSTGLMETRTENWDSFYSGESSVSPFRSLTVSSAFILASALPYAWHSRNMFIIFFGLVSVFVIVADSLLAAGRFNLAILFLVLVVSAAASQPQTNLLAAIGIRRLIIGLAIGFYFLVIFPTQRNPYLAESVQIFLQGGADASLANWVLKVSDLPGLDWVSVLGYSTAYFSGAIDKLNFFLNETDISTWYGLGSYNLPLSSQLYGLFSSDPSPWHEMRLRIAAIMQSQGWGLNPWATGVRDLTIDFGVVGALAICGLLGYLCQRVYLESFAITGYTVKVAAALISVSAFLFAFVGPFQVRLLVNTFILLGFLAFGRWLIVQALWGRGNP